MRALVILLTLIFFLSSLGFVQEGPEESYKIKVGDQLRVVVWKDLDFRIHVAPDGTIVLPMLGTFEAEGKTLSELEVAISERMKVEPGSPGASVVILVGDRERAIVVLGQIRSPGIYDELSLHRLIARAGGQTKDGSRRKFFIFRNGEVLEMRMFPRDYVLSKNDVVFVPKSRLAKFLTVIDTIHRSLVFIPRWYLPD